MRFEWDDEKNETNRRKHGFSFGTAVLILEDPNRDLSSNLLTKADE